MAVSILTISGAALLTSAITTIESGSLMSKTTVAEGIAEQLADEIGLIGFPRGVNVPPVSGTERALFDHVDDFADYDRIPPVDPLNRVLGTEEVSGVLPRHAALQPMPGYLDSFRQTVSVERILPNSNGFDVTAVDTDYRRVTVTVSYREANGNEIPLAKRTRILSRVGFTP